jgi:hypothetical protein
MNTPASQESSKQCKVCILLTATIDPKDIVFLKRNSPILREQDYIKAMQQWVHKIEYPIVFCENSSARLENIEEIVKNSAHKNVEFLQFDGQCFPRELGKGYGELLSIQYAIHHSKLIKNSDYIVKINGRYYMKNLKKIIETLSSRDDIYVMADVYQNFKAADSRIFVFTPSFILNYLSSLQGCINDSKGFSFEYALTRSILRAIADGHEWLPLSCEPLIDAYSGTNNIPFNKSMIKWIAREVGHSLKNYLNSCAPRFY